MSTIALCDLLDAFDLTDCDDLPAELADLAAELAADDGADWASVQPAETW